MPKLRGKQLFDAPKYFFIYLDGIDGSKVAEGGNYEMLF